MITWDVMVLNQQGKQQRFFIPFQSNSILEDTVFCDDNVGEDELLDSLINHDGYPSNIIVVKRG